jgi:hypothetical protein
MSGHKHKTSAFDEAMLLQVQDQERYVSKGADDHAHEEGEQSACLIASSSAALFGSPTSRRGFTRKKSKSCDQE